MTTRERMNVYLDKQTSDRLRQSAKELGINNSAMIRVMINEYYKNQDALKSMSDLNELLELMKKGEVIDE